VVSNKNIFTIACLNIIVVPHEQECNQKWVGPTFQFVLQNQEKL